MFARYFKDLDIGIRRFSVLSGRWAFPPPRGRHPRVYRMAKTWLWAYVVRLLAASDMSTEEAAGCRYSYWSIHHAVIPVPFPSLPRRNRLLSRHDSHTYHQSHPMRLHSGVFPHDFPPCFARKRSNRLVHTSGSLLAWSSSQIKWVRRSDLSRPLPPCTLIHLMLMGSPMENGDSFFLVSSDPDLYLSYIVARIARCYLVPFLRALLEGVP